MFVQCRLMEFVIRLWHGFSSHDLTIIFSHCLSIGLASLVNLFVMSCKKTPVSTLPRAIPVPCLCPVVSALAPVGPTPFRHCHAVSSNTVANMGNELCFKFLLCAKFFSCLPLLTGAENSQRRNSSEIHKAFLTPSRLFFFRRVSSLELYSNYLIFPYTELYLPRTRKYPLLFSFFSNIYFYWLQFNYKKCVNFLNVRIC